MVIITNDGAHEGRVHDAGKKEPTDPNPNPNPQCPKFPKFSNPKPNPNPKALSYVNP